MGRGQLLKNKVKQEKALAEARVIGEARGALKAKNLEDKGDAGLIAKTLGLQGEDKNALNSLLHSAKTHLGLMIDRVDPLELAAVIALTPLVKGAVDWTSDAAAKVVVGFTSPENIRGYAAAYGVFIRGDIPSNRTPASNLPDQRVNPIPTDEIIRWAISFGLTYLAVHNFGSLISAGGQFMNSLSMLKLAATLGGLTTV